MKCFDILFHKLIIHSPLLIKMKGLPTLGNRRKVWMVRTFSNKVSLPLVSGKVQSGMNHSTSACKKQSGPW